VRHDRCGRGRYDTSHFTSRGGHRERGAPGGDDLPPPIGIAPPITSDPSFQPIAPGLFLRRSAPKPIDAYEPYTRACATSARRDTAWSEIDRGRSTTRRTSRCGHRQDVGFPETDADISGRFIRIVIRISTHRRRNGRRTSTRASSTRTLEDGLPSTSRIRRPNPHDVPARGRDRRNKLQPEHVEGTMVLLMIAGIDTTWSAIGASLWHPRAEPRRPEAARERARAHGDRGRGAPAGVRHRSRWPAWSPRISSSRVAP